MPAKELDETVDQRKDYGPLYGDERYACSDAIQKRMSRRIAHIPVPK